MSGATRHGVTAFGARGGRRPGALRRVLSGLPPATVWIAGALLLLSTMLWAALTPATRAPDEVQHLNSILRVAEGGGWPKPGDARMEREVLDVRDLSGATRDGQRVYVPGSVNRTPGSVLFTDLTPTGVNDRKSLAALDDGEPPTAQMDQMTQHPPGYYAVTGALFKVVGAVNWRYDRALYFLRFLTGLSIAASVPLCLYLTTRDLTGREYTAQAAAFLPLLIPQLGFVGGAVTNDGLTIATASVLITVLVRLTTAGPTTRRLLAVAVATAAVCWTKGTALTLVPAVPLALAIAHRRAARNAGERRWIWPFLRSSVWVLGLAFVLGGWWWGLNYLRYGRIQPQAYETPPAPGPVLSFGDFFEVFQRRVSASFFGDIGLLEAPMPVLLTRTLTLVLLLLVVVGLWSRRHWGERVVFLIGIVLTFGVLLGTTYAAHRVTHNLPGLQGRYLFVLLVPLLSLVAVGLDRVIRLVRLPERTLLMVVPAVGAAVTALGLLLGFQTYYLAVGQSVGHALDILLGWSPWSWSVLAALVAAMIACGLALTFVLGRSFGAERGYPGGYSDGYADDLDDDADDDGGFWGNDDRNGRRERGVIANDTVPSWPAAGGASPPSGRPFSGHQPVHG